jgi:hypothetical protein
MTIIINFDDYPHHFTLATALSCTGMKKGNE